MKLLRLIILLLVVGGVQEKVWGEPFEEREQNSKSSASIGASEKSSEDEEYEILFGKEVLIEGRSSVIEFPITDSKSLRTLRESYGKKSLKARMLIAIPKEFYADEKVYPILIGSSTTDGVASNIGAAKDYVEHGLKKGFVVIGVDGEFGRPEKREGDSLDFRWVLVYEALKLMHQHWPNSKNWPIVTAGASGGGGYASHQMLKLIKKKYKPMGLLLLISLYSPMNFSKEYGRVSTSRLRHLPVFISAGEKDTVAKIEKMEKHPEDFKNAGFRRVRFEKFDGGHDIHQPHIGAALDWFMEKKTENRDTLLR